MKTFLTTTVVAAPLVAALQGEDDVKVETTEVSKDANAKPELKDFTSEDLQAWWSKSGLVFKDYKKGGFIDVHGPSDGSLGGDGSLVLDLAAAHAGRLGIPFAPHFGEGSNAYTVDSDGIASAKHGLSAKQHGYPFAVKSVKTKNKLEKGKKWEKASEAYDAFEFDFTKRKGAVLSGGSMFRSDPKDLATFLDFANANKFCFRWKTRFAGSFEKKLPEPPAETPAESTEGSKEEGKAVLELMSETKKDDEVKKEGEGEGEKQQEPEIVTVDDTVPTSVISAEQNYKDMLGELNYDEQWQSLLANAMNAIHDGLCEKVEIPAKTEGDQPTFVWRAKKGAEKKVLGGNKGLYENAAHFRTEIFKAYNRRVPSSGVAVSKPCTPEIVEKTVFKSTGDATKDNEALKAENQSLRTQLADANKNKPSTDGEFNALVAVAEGASERPPTLSEGGAKIYDKMTNQCTTTAIVMTVFTFILPIAVASLFILRSASDDDNAKDDEDDDAE